MPSLPRTGILLAGVLLTLFGPPEASARAELTLIQRSSGLQLPLKEEGHTEFEVGDVNGDGDLDIVSVGDHGSPYINSDQHGIMTWLGDGAGNWTVHQVGNFGYGGVALGDLDRDGLLDAAWGIHHDYGANGFGDALIGAALGDGTGLAWTPWGEGLATTGEDWGMFATDLADFDVDGSLDIISQSFGGSNGLRLYRNLGDGTWESAWVLAGGNVWYTIETGDFDADGFPDILCTRSGGAVYLGDGAFGFIPSNDGIATGTVRAVDAGDLNADGFDDIVVAITGAGVKAYVRAPDSGQWVDASDGLPASGSIDLVQFGDLNGDGLLDLVTYADPTGRTYLGDGQGSWVADATWTMPGPGEASALRVDGDIDHDGRDDIVVSATMSGFPFYRNQLRVYSPWLEPTALSARVITPNGGETLRFGGVRPLRWAAAVPPAEGSANVTLRLSLNGEEGPWTTIAEALPNSGRYEWLVDAAFSSSTCRLEVTVATGFGSVVARSERDFAILDVPVNGLDAGEPPGFGMASLSAFPNPFSRATRLRWSGPAGSDRILGIYTADGRLVGEATLSGPAPTRSRRWIRPPGLPRGVYFAVAHGGRDRASTRLIITGSPVE